MVLVQCNISLKDSNSEGDKNREKMKFRKFYIYEMNFKICKFGFRNTCILLNVFFFNKSKKFLFVALGEIGAHITKMGNKSFCEALCFSKSSESIVGIVFFTAILSVLLSDYQSTLLAHKA